MKKLTKNVANVANVELYAVEAPVERFCAWCDDEDQYDREIRYFNYIVSDEQTRRGAVSGMGSSVYEWARRYGQDINDFHFHIKVKSTSKYYAYDIDPVTKKNVLVKTW